MITDVRKKYPITQNVMAIKSFTAIMPYRIDVGATAKIKLPSKPVL